MRTRLFGPAVGLVVMILTRPHPAASQETVAIQFGFGRSYGIGGPYIKRAGIAASMSVARALRPSRPSSATIGIAVSVVGNPDSGDDICIGIPGRPGCTPLFPLFFGVAPELGWRHASAGARTSASVRVGVGPTWSGASKASATLSAHVQVTGAHRLVSGLDLTLGARATVFPRVTTNALLVTTGLVGVQWSLPSR
jgi:hypothetical protein